MAEKLIAEEGILKGLVLNLEEGSEWVVGRDPDEAQLLIEDPSASRKHLVLRRTPEGITLENLSETNPVEVNDTPLTGTHLLANGDLVKIGSGIYRYVMDKVPQPTPSPEEVPEVSAEETPETAETDEKAAPSETLSQEEFDEAWEKREDTVFEDIEETLTPDKSEGELEEISFDLFETGRWLLKVVGGPNQGAEFPMAAGNTYTIGTDPNSCDIVFHDTSVSRQHARISITEDERITIEDLKSRNGTLIDGKPIQGRQNYDMNSLVTVGTTSFAIYDREGKMQTVISPLLPSIVKVLQQEEEKEKQLAEESAKARALEEEYTRKMEEVEALAAEQAKAEKGANTLNAFILIGIITGLFVLGGASLLTLFSPPKEIVKEQVNSDTQLAQVMAPYPQLKTSFNPSTGRLYLAGHVSTAGDRNQLMYSLQSLPFVKYIDDSGVVIDEYVWQEINAVLSKNSNWRGVTLQSHSPGHFALVGTLQTKRQADELYDYMTQIFPYLDRLERKVIVDEELTNTVNSTLQKVGLYEITGRYQNGDLVLTGGVPKGKQEEFNAVIEELKKIPGVRNVRANVNTLPQAESMINISSNYEVSGFSRIGDNLSVVVNGRIVTRGDVLDGMKITEITPNVIFLEKDGIIYRIDYNR